MEKVEEMFKSHLKKSEISVNNLRAIFDIE